MVAAPQHKPRVLDRRGAGASRADRRHAADGASHRTSATLSSSWPSRGSVLVASSVRSPAYMPPGNMRLLTAGAQVSAQTGCRVLAKAEHLSPGGSVKDRVAIAMVLAAESRGELTPGQQGVVVAATRGNTGALRIRPSAALGFGLGLTTPAPLPQCTHFPSSAAGPKVSSSLDTTNAAVPPTREIPLYIK